MARWNWRTRVVVAVGALGLSTPTWASDSGEPVDATYVSSVGPGIAALIATGMERSSSFWDLVARIERTDWAVFIMRARCPAPEIVAYPADWALSAWPRARRRLGTKTADS